MPYLDMLQMGGVYEEQWMDLFWWKNWKQNTNESAMRNLYSANSHQS